MITNFNHVGFVVKNIDEKLDMLSKAFGAVELERRSFPELGQTSSIVKIGDSMYELMEPLGTEGVVAKFIAKRGEGFHHISLRCDDTDKTRKELEDAGVQIVNRINETLFTNPKTTGGVLYEITTREF